MTRSEFLHLIPYLASLLITSSVLAYVWSRRSAQGARAFAGYLLGQSLWIIGFILELLSMDISGKIFWDGFQWFASFFAVIALPIFAVQYTELTLKSPRTRFGSLLIGPILFSLFLLLDPTLHWVYANPRLSSSSPFAEMLYDFTPVIYVYAIYVYATAAWGLYTLVQRAIQSHGFYRTQTALITLGVFIPVLGSVFSLLNIPITPQRDAFPFTSAIGNLVIAWGLFRFRIFDVTPIVRDKVFEAIVDPVVILDNKNTVVDINSAMLVLLGKSSEEVIGHPAQKVFNDFPIPIKMYMHVSYARDVATFVLGGKNIYYELTVWPLFNARKEITGRVYISHDITALKELEQELRKLNTELEDRVRARTGELAEAYDTTLEGWARALELRDRETEGHSRRVTESTLTVARAMNLPEEDIEHIRRGAILHDIGKMSIPDEILHKPGALTEDERAIVNQHPETAYTLLSPIPFLEKALEIPYCHHEKWDGTGYPQGLKGREIPLSARIFAVADVWDALCSDRPYNAAWLHEKAIAYIIKQSGQHFDPRVVNVFLNLVEKGKI